MTDDSDQSLIDILSRAPPLDTRLLEERPLLMELYRRILALGFEGRVASRLFLIGWTLSGLQRRGRTFEHHRGGPLPQGELARVAKLTSTLINQLQGLDTEVEGLLAIGLDDRGCSLSRIKGDMETLLQVADELAAGSKRTRGGQEDHATLRSFTMLVWTYEQVTGERVGRTALRNLISDPHLSGRGGQFITEWFELVDPTVTAGTLFRLWPKMRKRLHDSSGELASDVESVRRIQSDLLRGLAMNQ